VNVSNLQGKTALVTGAGSGIGRATALALARRGAKLALCDVNEGGLAETEAKARAQGCEVLAQRVDVSRREEMRAFSEAVHRWVEAIDLLMNNAGVGLGAKFLDSTLEDWNWIIGVNLMGVIHGCHFFLPAMVRRGAGGHRLLCQPAALCLLHHQVRGAGVDRGAARRTRASRHRRDRGLPRLDQYAHHTVECVAGSGGHSRSP